MRKTMQTEHVILLNAQGVSTDTPEKYAAYTVNTLLRLAFSNWLLNAKGQLSVTRHVLSKKAWPDVQTNSAYGHPRLGGNNEEAVIRRCYYELSVEITPPESTCPNLRYHVADPNDIVENEVCPVFAVRTTGALQINDDGVVDYQQCDLAVVLRDIGATPWAFSPWMVMQVTNCEARKRLSVSTQLKWKILTITGVVNMT